MMRAVLFPGQGMQYAECLADWEKTSTAVRELLDVAESHLKVKVTDLLDRGGRLLEDPAVLQPVLTALALGIHGELVRRGLDAGLVAGHSLGEIAALAAAGAVTSEDAVFLATMRGRFMADQAGIHPGGMVALADMGISGLADALARGRGQGVLDIAAHNSPREWVLSGDHAAIGAVLAVYPGRRLDVAGPWHASTMMPAERAFRSVMEDCSLSKPGIGLIGNLDGKPLDDPAVMPKLIAGQLTNPVAWTAVMATMDSLGIEEYVIPGPGKVLRGLVRANLGRSIPARVVQYPSALGFFEEEGRS